MISLAFAGGILVAAILAWRLLPGLSGWPPALGLVIAVFTVVPPHATLAFGVGADDLLFVLGLILLAPFAWRTYRRGAFPTIPYGRWLGLGIGLLIAGMVVSAFVNSTSASETVELLLRGAGRMSLYALAVVVVVAQVPAERTRAVVARSLAALATLEALVGLAAYTVGLPGGFGLERAQGNTALVGEIPGRISGTLELSPNFLGALFVLSIPVTLGIALDAGRRGRWLWGLSVAAQIAGLVLTYTRASLVVMVLACAVVLALRVRLRWLAFAAVAMSCLVWLTPAVDRIITDHTDRLALYVSAIRVFLAHPVAGVGPGLQAEFTAADPERFRATGFGVAGNNAHNTVLLAAAENGVLGLVGAVILNVALVLVAVAVIRRARELARPRSEPLAIGVAVLAFLLQGMANNLFTVTLTATMLVLLVAGCAVPWLLGDPRDEDRIVGCRPGDEPEQGELTQANPD